MKLTLKFDLQKFLILLFLVGWLMNRSVMLANGGHMPVYHSHLSDPIQIKPTDHIHVWMTPATRGKFFCDWIPLIPHGLIASPGDVLVLLWPVYGVLYGLFYTSLILFAFGWALVQSYRGKPWKP